MNLKYDHQYNYTSIQKAENYLNNIHDMHEEMAFFGKSLPPVKESKPQLKHSIIIKDRKRINLN